MNTQVSETTLASTQLAPAPQHVVLNGSPASGRYAGCPEQIDWSGLTGAFRRSAWWRHFHHKRWHYLGIATEHCFIGVAIVDVGWTNTAFAYVFDRDEKKLLVDYSQDGLPGLTAHVADRPTLGARTWFRHLGAHLRYAHVGGSRYQLTVDIGQKLQMDAMVDMQHAAPVLTAIGEIFDGGCAHCTVKSSALAVSGHAHAAGKSFNLNTGVASFDYSNGLLGRNTQWRWASAHSPALGFNLQQGYFGRQENVLWLEGEPILLGNAEFGFDPQHPLAPWRIRTDDGLLDLVFEPEGARQEQKNLWVAASYYVQPIGTFSGTVRPHAQGPVHQVKRLVGVTEDHRSRW